MQGYEIVTIVDPQIADEDVPKTSEKINEFITSRGGSIARVQRWGRRRLAYPIQRQTEAHYLLTTFALEPQHTSELEADLVLAQEVLKHMVIKVDEDELRKAAEAPPPPPPVVETPSAPAESAASTEAPVAAAEATAAEAPTEEAPAVEAPAAEATAEAEPAAEASEAETAEAEVADQATAGESGAAEESVAEAAEQPEAEEKGEV